MAEPKAAKSKSSSKPSKKHHDEAASKKATKPKAAPAPSLDAHFKPCADVTGLRFGAQLVTRALTVRRAGPLELPHLLRVSPDSGGGEKQSQNNQTLSFAPTTTAYIPTSFTILAHHAWHTLTLGLGTRNSKAVIFVFDSGAAKAACDAAWPGVVPLGDVGRRLLRAAPGSPEMARFKFRKGCVTFYVYAVRAAGARGFARADELRAVVEAVAGLKDFLDHTAMLALPGQRSIDAAPSPAPAPAGVVH
ncbi:uncharacterized protein LOC100846252 [Brachypodium distachyon]|uniref:DUF7851 domain-containing protein n=1 Tax=Brachypodium distachyon TaxID=15368 RepID=I1IHD8_BRADI|nr:uncharacterized protein LOC100846252 [Brachypodium distachyon]KQJ86257.1 hypothetical protein BRADI_4g04300v3 [Brachypodium distachyon]|eukprot:XP_024310958.1 uncharacterized protein LOC100846252 [Brachypodium distachyon]